MTEASKIKSVRSRIFLKDEPSSAAEYSDSGVGWPSEDSEIEQTIDSIKSPVLISPRMVEPVHEVSSAAASPPSPPVISPRVLESVSEQEVRVRTPDALTPKTPFNTPVQKPISSNSHNSVPTQDSSPIRQRKI